MSAHVQHLVHVCIGFSLKLEMKCSVVSALHRRSDEGLLTGDANRKEIWQQTSRLKWMVQLMDKQQGKEQTSLSLVSEGTNRGLISSFPSMRGYKGQFTCYSNI